MAHGVKIKAEQRGLILCCAGGIDCMNSWGLFLHYFIWSLVRGFCRWFCFWGVTQHLFICTHHPSLQSTDRAFFYFSSCKQHFLGSIFTFLVPKLSDHKELISQQTCWTGTQWKDSWGKIILHRDRLQAGDHPGWCARRYSAEKAPELGENLGLNPLCVLLTECAGQFHNLPWFDWPTYTVAFDIPSPSQTETCCLVQYLCKR